jgi:glutamine amidotransferase-like uncharacterized protein
MMAALLPLRLARILIYNGKGANYTSAKALFEQCCLHSSKKYVVRYTAEEELQGTDWLHSTKTLIMGGGSPTEWAKALGDETLKKIQSFVFEGGTFCGVCAGAYFASETSIFLDKKTVRPYPLFSGQSLGPLFSSFENYNDRSPETAKATKITLNGKDEDSGYLFYLGGPSFTPNNQQDTTVLASFCNTPCPAPAIIRHTFGKGIVVLSGVHPEFSGRDHDPNLCDSLPMKNIIYTLLQSETFRQKTLQTILSAAQVIENDETSAKTTGEKLL